MPEIKFCGLTRPGDVAWAAAAGVDLIGFNFCPESPRFITLEKARDLARESGDAALAGVFVNADLDRIRSLAEAVPLDMIQLSGDETPHFCRRLKRATGLSLARVFRPPGDGRPVSAGAWLDCVDYAVLDAPCPPGSPGNERGGTGRRVTAAAAAWAGSLGLPFLLAGGLTPGNVARAISLFRPWGVDVASGIEESPGRKCPRKMALFLEAVRSAGQGSPTTGRP